MMWKVKKFLRSLCHPIEAFFAYIAYKFIGLLNPDTASSLGGWLGRKLIPLTSATRTARRNLQFVFPDNTQEENNQIIEKVCDNFGRIMAEYIHLPGMNIYDNPRFQVEGIDIIDQLKNDDNPAIIFGAHLASWEVAIMALNQRGLETTQLYRRINNPYINQGVLNMQRRIGREVLTKGSDDAKKVLDVIKRGDHLFMLVDQKLNGGLPIPFFGREAMTAPAAARLAMKYKCPLVPAQVERIDNFSFKITIHPPLELDDTGDLTQDLYNNLCKMNQSIEEWVLHRPDQWLWLHNRWPKSEKDIKSVRIDKTLRKVS